MRTHTLAPRLCAFSIDRSKTASGSASTQVLLWLGAFSVHWVMGCVVPTCVSGMDTAAEICDPKPGMVLWKLAVAMGCSPLTCAASIKDDAEDLRPNSLGYVVHLHSGLTEGVGCQRALEARDSALGDHKEEQRSQHKLHGRAGCKGCSIVPLMVFRPLVDWYRGTVKPLLGVTENSAAADPSHTAQHTTMSWQLSLVPSLQRHGCCPWQGKRDSSAPQNTSGNPSTPQEGCRVLHM